MPTLEKILIIRFSSIGDIILTSPLVRTLRNAFPHSRIDFLVKSEYAELVQFNSHLSSVIRLRSSDRSELVSLRRRIRAEKYSAIFDLHNSLRSRSLRMFSGAKTVRVFRKYAVARFLMVNAKKSYYPDHAAPVAERYLDTARSFGISDDRKGLEVAIPEDIRSSVAVMLSKYKLERHKRIVGIVPCSKHATKCWLPERFLELCLRLAVDGATKTLIFGGREDAEYCGDLAQMINAKAGWTAAESLAGKLSLLETGAAFDHCSLVVTNDTGLMHLAAARKRKVVAIFGSTVKEFGFFPFGTEHIVIERKGLHCRPCSHIGLPQCPEGHFRCMKEIEVDEVFAAAREMLDSPSSQMVPAHVAE